MRANPGLLSPQSRLAQRVPFGSANGSFGLTEALRHAVDGPVNGERAELAAATASQVVTSLAVYYGALDAAVARLEPYHVYSHVGRGTGGFGTPIATDHRFAVAFTVEMAHEMVATAPLAPTVMESARQYVEAARVAVQLAGAIRELGWSARAHTDGNYRVIAPLVARDAGLGEIGRMGLLMTPKRGPRVRLGVVTTDMELEPTGRTDGRAIIDYCSVCSKCVDNCPPRAIPSGDRAEFDGSLRWRIDSDACYAYWTIIGTDCARCMAVCPYSHPASFSHNAVRWALGRSGAVRRLAVILDDLLYGREPPTKDPPSWLPPV
jgi:ferredoxin